MTIVLCIVSEKGRGGRRHNVYFDTFRKLLPIEMGCLSENLHSFEEILELEYMNISTNNATDAEEPKEIVFVKSYKAILPYADCETFLSGY